MTTLTPEEYHQQGIIPVAVTNVEDLGPIFEGISATREVGNPHTVCLTEVLPTVLSVAEDQPGESLAIGLFNLDKYRTRAVIFNNGNVPVVFCHSKQQAEDQSKNILTGSSAVSGALVPANSSFTHEGNAPLWVVIGSTANQPIPPNPDNAFTGENSVTSPGALTTIAGTGPVPAGTYQVYVWLTLSGTVAAGTDNNNVRINSNGGTPSTIVLDNNIGTATQQFGPFNVTAPGGGNAIQVQTIGAGTVGSIYSATIEAIPLTEPAFASVGYVSERID